MRRYFSVIFSFVLVIGVACGPLFGPPEEPRKEQLKNPVEKPASETEADRPSTTERRKPVEKPPQSPPPTSRSDPEPEPVRFMTKWPDQEKTSTESMCQSVLSIDFPAPLPAIGELKDRFLKSHNDVRRRYKQKELVWDDDLAAYAQRWANHLKTERKCLMQHRRKAGITEGKVYGENLAWNWTSQTFVSGKFHQSPESAVYGWSRECADYDYKTNTCKPDEKCGHFTQVIWHSSERVGCGVAVCRDGTNESGGVGHAEVWVCNYDPPGNWIGEKPY